ncbi:cytochrome P450 [Purpureocillium lavendulum]|uniref:Cytochrome P450 n=1 Tax=Purpureocillium lavendulum TaxID=1247861 RepID=A0AB34FGB5_9HYPO|nr:cytochrome P450 [Purpureocillium lavendulum]
MLEKKRVQQLDIPSRKGYDAIFNSNLLDDIPEAVAQWGSTRVLLVASRALAANSDSVAALQSALGAKLVDTKLGVGSHSPYADVRDIAHRVQTHRVDCVISIGSCSYSDACKIACLLAANLDPGFTEDDMEALVDKERGIADKGQDGKPLKPRACRLVTVPTSLSASEWNALSSATNAQGKKQHFGNWDEGHPDLILLDPEVAATSPERLWLSSGVRCVDHCVELMCNPKSGEDGCDGLHAHAERGLRCMITGLTEYKQAKATGETGEKNTDLLLEGISECQYGSREALTGLLIWRVPMGPSHAIGHQLGAVANVMHGITSCIMLAPVLRWQAAHLSDPYYKETQAKILRIFNDTLGWQEASAADAVEKFVKSLGLPTTLREVGVTSDEQVRKIADKTMTDVWGGGKRQMEFDDVMQVLESVRG